MLLHRLMFMKHPGLITIFDRARIFNELALQAFGDSPHLSYSAQNRGTAMERDTRIFKGLLMLLIYFTSLVS